MVIAKFEKTIIPRTLEGQKFADEYERKIRERERSITTFSRSEDGWSIIIELQYYEEVEDGDDD